MLHLWGRDWTRRELMRYLGDESQAFGLREGELTQGRGRGMRTVELATGGGLAVTILPDRCLDAAQCSLRGTPLSFVSRVGLAAPAYYEPEGAGFLRNFTAGLVTTCGLTHMGAACEDEGETLGLHGRIGNTPAEDVSARGAWQGDDYVMTVSGTVSQCRVFGEHLRLHRTWTAWAGQNRLRLEDVVENVGYDDQPLMALYHCNLGFPLVGPGTRLVTAASRGVRPRDAAAEGGLDAWDRFSEPIHGYAEQCFYHDLLPEEDGWAWARLENPAMNLAVTLRYDRQNLPYLVEWKQMGEGDYVCGLEPGTWAPEGRAEARRRGELRRIAPGETVRFALEFQMDALDKEEST